MSAGTPVTREMFISPDHVQTALRGENWPHTPAMMTVVSDEGQMHDVPVPAEWVQRGTLPQGYAVDFLFDPEELVAKVNNAGKSYMEELPLEMVQKMTGIVNAPGNLKIVPQWLYDRKREIISRSVAESTTPEAVMQQIRAEINSREQAESSSEGKKEKKKGFFKGLFSGKK